MIPERGISQELSGAKLQRWMEDAVRKCGSSPCASRLDPHRPLPRTRNGRAVGVNREWRQNGTLASERVLAEDGPALQSHQEWDDSGQPTKG